MHSPYACSLQSREKTADRACARGACNEQRQHSSASGVRKSSPLTEEHVQPAGTADVRRNLCLVRVFELVAATWDPSTDGSHCAWKFSKPWIAIWALAASYSHDHTQTTAPPLAGILSTAADRRLKVIPWRMRLPSLSPSRSTMASMQCVGEQIFLVSMASATVPAGCRSVDDKVAVAKTHHHRMAPVLHHRPMHPNAAHERGMQGTVPCARIHA